MKKSIVGATYEFWSVARDHYAVRVDDIDKLGWSEKTLTRLRKRAEELRAKG